MNIEGFVEQLSESQARGWVYSPENPTEHLTIDILLGERSIARGQADLFRADLEKAGVGDGDHAFVINFDRRLAATELIELKIYCYSPGEARTTIDFLKTEARATDTHDQDATQTRDVLGAQLPLFILGAARSGTSALAQSLLKSGFYEGYEEGHLLDLAAGLVNAARLHYEANGDEVARPTLIAGVPLRFIDEKIKDIFRDIGYFYFRGTRWLDKTPRKEMIYSAQILREIWPNARFVYLKRRAIENIVSRLQKFPTIEFEAHCRDWVESMAAWRRVRQALDGAGIEIEHLQMALGSVDLIRELQRFLELPDAVAQRVAGLLAAEQPERTAEKVGIVYDIDELSWTTDQKVAFRDICETEMKAFGYSYNKNYYAI